MKRPLPILAAAAVFVALVVGILQSGGGHDNPAAGVAPTPAATRQALAGSPAPLAALHGRANALLPIGGLEAQIRALRGFPIVLNVWGSWCNPCREEFPVLQRVAASEGRRVAFIGVATQDSKENAGAFLRKHPVSYPSFMDFDGKVADGYGVIGAPATIFFDRRGRRAYFHQGKYETDADLEADIRRYAGA
jgi:cytochrome c biogenesis protein CcmG, thiol:disulfide interchange protein DsbE